jgi:hypothetical protein
MDTTIVIIVICIAIMLSMSIGGIVYLLASGNKISDLGANGSNSGANSGESDTNLTSGNRSGSSGNGSNSGSSSGSSGTNLRTGNGSGSSRSNSGSGSSGTNLTSGNGSSSSGSGSSGTNLTSGNGSSSSGSGSSGSSLSGTVSNNTPTSTQLTDQQKCDAETADYIKLNPGSSWENYIKYGITNGQTWSGPGCPAVYPGQEEAAKLKKKCDDETADYIKSNPGSSWENYIKYGISLGQTWSGPGCPALYPGQEEAAKLKKKCDDETADYIKSNPGSSWENYIKYGISLGQTWSGPGCPALYPGVEQAKRDELKEATTNKTQAIANSKIALSKVTIGGSVQCTVDVPGGKNPGATYRLDSGSTLKWYPTADIARSWNSSWDKAPAVISDCSEFTLGSNMALHPPVTLPNVGSSVKCAIDVPGGQGANFAIYRLSEANTLRWYPTDSIARSWDPNYAQATTISDCSSLTRGPDMELNPFPDGLLTYGNNGTMSGTQYCAKYRQKKCIKQIVKSDPTNKTKFGDSVGCDVLVGSAGNAQLGAMCSNEDMVLSLPYDYSKNDGTVDGYTYCKGNYESSSPGQDKNLGCSYGVIYGDPAQWNKRVQCDYKAGTNTAYKCEPRIEKDWNACNPFTEVSGSHKHDDWCRNDLGDNYYHARDGNGCGQGGWHGMCRNYIE